ncbi:MAG TPA: tetratricopeptide repeat protein, partial [Gemmatales bacterium]|nr:tetratricopeptide repeat protein [Gemmatales bacterium]
LQEVVEGKYDVEAARKNFLAEKENEKKLDILRAKFAKARQEGPAAMIKVLDEAIQDTPTLETTLGMTKFNLLLQDKSNSDLAMKYGERLLNEVFKDDFTRLNELSWILVDPDKPDKANEAQADFAVKAARRAVELSMEKDHAVLDTLACAYFAAGDKAKAIEYIEKALKLQDEPEYRNRLEMFKK